MCTHRLCLTTTELMRDIPSCPISWWWHGFDRSRRVRLYTVLCVCVVAEQLLGLLISYRFGYHAGPGVRVSIYPVLCCGYLVRGKPVRAVRNKQLGSLWGVLCGVLAWGVLAYL